MGRRFLLAGAKPARQLSLQPVAVGAVNRYLSLVGRDGEHYRDALAVLVNSERGLREPAAIRAAEKPPGADLEPERRTQAAVSFQGEPRCTSQTEETSWWMELSNRTGCYVWNPNPQPGETVTWTGGCVEGVAQGTGTLRWVAAAGERTEENTGRLQTSQPDGRWVIHNVIDSRRYTKIQIYENGKLVDFKTE